MVGKTHCREPQRPQEAINADLDSSDLFVGLIWRRWGQPTGHPDFSSGFEKEFHRARDRRSQSGQPEIWLFFKDIEPGQLQDPGEQLQKGLLFKEMCRSEKKLLYKAFGTTEDWTLPQSSRPALRFQSEFSAKVLGQEPLPCHFCVSQFGRRLSPRRRSLSCTSRIAPFLGGAVGIHLFPSRSRSRPRSPGRQLRP